MRATHAGTALGVVLLLTALSLGGGRAAAAPAGSPWGADYFPNIALVNQDGQTLHFYDDVIEGKVVALNFIFTRCEGACPLETAKLRQVQDLLGERMGRDVFFYSISIDPERDTPAVLKAYAGKFKVGPGWQFLTGNKADITRLREKLGLLRAEGGAENLNAHNTTLIVGNEATARWIKRSPFDTPKVLAALLGDQLHNATLGNAGRKSYAEVPPLPQFSRGEYLYRTRCQSCHTVGAGDGVGPDLKGVTEKRERAWLTRWLKVPDEMLKEKDPLALALFAQYQGLAMPNLKLNDVDARALIQYLAAESQRLDAAPPPGAPDAAHTVRAPEHGGG